MMPTFSPRSQVPSDDVCSIEGQPGHAHTEWSTKLHHSHSQGGEFGQGFLQVLKPGTVFLCPDLEGDSISPNSLQKWRKRSHLFGRLQHQASLTWSISRLIKMFLLSSLATPTPLTTNRWKHTVLTSTFWGCILWVLASSTLADFILLASHGLCLPVNLQNLFSLQCLFSQDNRRKKIWIMKFSHISYEKYIKLTFCTSRDCNLSLVVLPLFAVVV